MFEIIPKSLEIPNGFYTFTGQGANDEYFFDIKVTAGGVSKNTPINGGKFFFVCSPSTGTGKIRFLADGRIESAQHQQTVAAVFSYVFVQGKLVTNIKFEGSIGFENSVDIVQ